MTLDVGGNILSKFQLPSSYGFGVLMSPMFGVKGGLTEGRHQIKSVLLLGNVQRRIQPESKSFEIVLLSPILTAFFTLKEERGA